MEQQGRELIDRCAAAGKFIDEAVVRKDADRFLSLLQNTAQPFHLLPVFLRGSVGIEQYAAYAAAEKRLISLLFAEKAQRLLSPLPQIVIAQHKMNRNARAAQSIRKVPVFQA